MWESFDKLPPFLQVCFGLGVGLAALWGVLTTLRARKIFQDGPDNEDDTRDIYSRMGELGKRLDLRYDLLDGRVRTIAEDVAEIKGQLSNRSRGRKT